MRRHAPPCHHTPVLLVHGEKAHSRYFSEDAFGKLQGQNKELLIVPGASHVDLYDDQAGTAKKIISSDETILF